MLVLALYGSLERSINYFVFVFGVGCLGCYCVVSCCRGLLFQLLWVMLLAGGQVVVGGRKAPPL